jgi:3-hydroxypropanoate dehydrogenase
MTSFSLEAHPPLRELDEAGRELLFTDAHTVYRFSGGTVPDAKLTEIWELAKWGPSSANTQPLRIVYLRTPEARERLIPHVARGNQGKVASAAATALLAADLRFHRHVPRVMPLRPDYREMFEDDEPRRREHARDNAVLQSGYVILAIRAVGLTAGPFTGFDQASLDADFFPDGQLTTVMAVNIGLPDPNGAVIARLPKLDDDEVITWL